MSTCTFCECRLGHKSFGSSSGWGVSMIGLAFSKSFGPLLANRFLLGLFEAVNIPLFSELTPHGSAAWSDPGAVVTMTWYRRREQPFRVACWYGTK